MDRNRTIAYTALSIASRGNESIDDDEGDDDDDDDDDQDAAAAAINDQALDRQLSFID